MVGEFYFSVMNSFLIAGLGNIGAEYAHTRHNIGFDVADAFALKYDAGWHLDRLAEVAQFSVKGRQVTLIKPTTYMNLSGKAFLYWQSVLKIPLERTLTIVDDLALPIEKIRIRPSGSHAGHNGLRSIEEALGTNQYPKLRFGIGDQFPKGKQADFVLSTWKPEEKALIERKTEVCSRILYTVIMEGITPAMNQFNHLVFN